MKQWQVMHEKSKMLVQNGEEKKKNPVEIAPGLDFLTGQFIRRPSSKC